MEQTLARFEEYCNSHGVAFERDVALSEHSSFRIGGPAAFFLCPRDEAQVRAVLEGVVESGITLLVLGKGSNILFDDKGFAGAVLHLGSGYGGIRLLDDRTIECDSGATLTQLCHFAWEHALTGLEFAYGIPGSVGGAIFMNAGAYGGEMKDVLVCSRHIALDGTSGEYRGEEMGLSYRHSVYAAGGFVITGGTFRLQPGDRDGIRARMNHYMGLRREKQPLEYASAGSTFKRPQGDYASALIDRCGLKGRRVGCAAVSEKHAGFIINTGRATGADVRELIEIVRREVREKTGYDLSCEVRIIPAE